MYCRKLDVKYHKYRIRNIYRALSSIKKTYEVLHFKLILILKSLVEIANEYAIRSRLFELRYPPTEHTDFFM